ncbi:hypothetical protein NVP1084O_119 [Vibrio phage 1.084.O._10N.261.49.F5]|nr:hypothetical protein NVP1084O_119 [Vibrio phage 1.084.O._10N.261.49.F5]
MAVSEHYNLNYLISNQKLITQRDVGKLGRCLNKLYSLFPLDKSAFPTITQPWAFKCVCGIYVVQSYSAVLKGRNKSCGCHRRSKGLWDSYLRVYRKSLNSNYTIIESGAHIRSRDWKIMCEICKTVTFKGSALDHLQGNNQFCKCSNLYRYPYSYIKEECLDFVKGTNWDIQRFPSDFTTKSKLRVNLKCKICNYENDMLYTNLIKGRGCYSCANKRTSDRLSKDTSWFIEESSKVHGYKYDYSLSEYKSAKEKVEIICPHHKLPFHFLQSPDNHKNKGKGCPECKKLRLKRVSFKKINFKDNEDYYKTLRSGVYILSLGGVTKIGITCDVVRRCYSIKRDSKVSPEIILYKEFNTYDALHLENKLHKYFEDQRHIFNEVWAGHSECFDLTKDQIEDAVNIINRYKDE